jgi:hypothetical protein
VLTGEFDPVASLLHGTIGVVDKDSSFGFDSLQENLFALGLALLAIIVDSGPILILEKVVPKCGLSTSWWSDKENDYGELGSVK